MVSNFRDTYDQVGIINSLSHYGLYRYWRDLKGLLYEEVIAARQWFTELLLTSESMSRYQKDSDS